MVKTGFGLGFSLAQGNATLAVELGAISANASGTLGTVEVGPRPAATVQVADQLGNLWTISATTGAVTSPLTGWPAAVPPDVNAAFRTESFVGGNGGVYRLTGLISGIPAHVINATGLDAAIGSPSALSEATADVAAFVSGGVGPFVYAASHGSVLDGIWTWTTPETAGDVPVTFDVTDARGVLVQAVVTVTVAAAAPPATPSAPGLAATARCERPSRLRARCRATPKSG